MRPREYALHLGLALAYAMIYGWCYASFLHYHFAYVGMMELYARPTEFMVLSYVIAALPILAYRGVRAISSAISVLIYILLYVPIVMTFALGGEFELGHIVLVQLTFLVGMTMLFGADGIIVKNPVTLNLGVNLMPVVLGITVASTLYALAVYGTANLRLVTFGADLYEQRFLANEAGGGLLIRYVTAWMTTVMIPLCLAYGFTAKKPLYIAMPVLSSVLMYMAAANKITILLPFVYAVMYMLLGGNRLRALYPILAASTAAAIALMIYISTKGAAAFLAASLILYRTIGNGGWITKVYYEFFSFHPQTEYSHVMGIKELTKPYPYGDLGVGQVVGQFYWEPNMNANANFWATDGIASMGLPGVLVASLATTLLLMAMNSITRTYDKLFVLLSFLPFISILLNQSMFSSIWSGGGFFLLVFFLFNKRAPEEPLLPVPLAPNPAK